MANRDKQQQKNIEKWLKNSKESLEKNDIEAWLDESYGGWIDTPDPSPLLRWKIAAIIASLVALLFIFLWSNAQFNLLSSPTPTPTLSGGGVAQAPEATGMVASPTLVTYTPTPVPPTNTPVPPTNTPVPPTNTPVPPTAPPTPKTLATVPTEENIFWIPSSEKFPPTTSILTFNKGKSQNGQLNVNIRNAPNTDSSRVISTFHIYEGHGTSTFENTFVIKEDEKSKANHKWYKICCTENGHVGWGRDDFFGPSLGQAKLAQGVKLPPSQAPLHIYSAKDGAVNESSLGGSVTIYQSGDPAIPPIYIYQRSEDAQALRVLVWDSSQNKWLRGWIKADYVVLPDDLDIEDVPTPPEQ